MSTLKPLLRETVAHLCYQHFNFSRYRNYDFKDWRWFPSRKYAASSSRSSLTFQACQRPDEGNSKHLRNVFKLLPNYTRCNVPEHGLSSNLPSWEPEILHFKFFNYIFFTCLSFLSTAWKYICTLYFTMRVCRQTVWFPIFCSSHFQPTYQPFHLTINGQLPVPIFKHLSPKILLRNIGAMHSKQTLCDVNHAKEHTSRHITVQQSWYSWLNHILAWSVSLC